MSNSSLLMIVYLVGHVTSYGCGPCMCTKDEKSMLHVNCSDRGLTSVPDDLPLSTRFLDLSYNSIASENLNSICDYTLLTLDLSGNQLQSLSSRQFIKCYIGESVDFTDNALEEVSNGSLIGLQNLKKVTNLESLYYHSGALSTLVSLVELSMVIHQSNITENMFANLDRLQVVSVDIRNARSIPGNIFKPISSTVRKLKMVTKSLSVITTNILKDCSVLEEFILLSRNLYSLPATLFNSAPELRTICMRGVGSLPRYIFDNLDKLETLELHGVEDMPSDIFVGLLRLKTLDLSECSITTIPYGWFKDMLSLESLNLEYVGLRFLTADDFIGLEKLVRVELSNNRLRSLDAFSFANVNLTVGYIGLSGNELKVIDEDIFTDLIHLETLDLSSNKIHSISEIAFDSLPGLKYLNLHDNKIYALNGGVFESNDQLEILDLSSNVISETEASVFDHLYSLRVLNVSDNRLKNITHIIVSLTPSVKILDLSLNHLKCECISPRILTVLENVTLLGTCEDIDGLLEEVLLQSFIHSEVCMPKSTPKTSTYPVASPSVVKASVINTSRTITKTTGQTTNMLQKNISLTGWDAQTNYTVEGGYSKRTNQSSEIRHTTYGGSSKHLKQNNTLSDTLEQKTENPKAVSASPKSSFIRRSNMTLVHSKTIDIKTARTVPTTRHTALTTRKQVTHFKPKLGMITLSPLDDTNNSSVKFVEPPEDGNTNTEAAFGFEEKEPTSNSYYIAIACISVVSVFSIAILVYLWYRKMRRQRGYEVSNIAGQDLSNIVAGANGHQTGSTNGPVTLTSVPSIQIDKVHDDAKTDSTNAK